MKTSVIIFLFLLITSIAGILVYFVYLPYLDNKHYKEGKKLISKFREVKKKDKTFNSIKKYYINLDRSIGRKESIEKEFRLYGITNYERVAACDGKNLKSTKEGDFGDFKFKAPDDIISNKFSISCTISHIKAIKKSYDNGDKLSIIMEDDIKFTLIPYWDKELKEIIDELPDDWEILRLVSYKDIWVYCFNKTINPCIIKRKKNSSSAVCYLINRKCMKKFIDKYIQDDCINLYNNNNGIDSKLFNDFNVYDLKKDLFLLDNLENDSIIGNNRKNSIYQSLRILKSYDI